MYRYLFPLKVQAYTLLFGPIRLLDLSIFDRLYSYIQPILYQVNRLHCNTFHHVQEKWVYMKPDQHKMVLPASKYHFVLPFFCIFTILFLHAIIFLHVISYFNSLLSKFSAIKSLVTGQKFQSCHLVSLNVTICQGG